jgi:hypothetical protein
VLKLFKATISRFGHITQCHKSAKTYVRYSTVIYDGIFFSRAKSGYTSILHKHLAPRITIIKYINYTAVIYQIKIHLMISIIGVFFLLKNVKLNNNLNTFNFNGNNKQLIPTLKSSIFKTEAALKSLINIIVYVELQSMRAR